MLNKKRYLQLLALVLVALLPFSGCSDDDCAICPAEKDTGTIVIDPSPNGLNAPWTLTGPGGYNKTGRGDHTLNSLAVGPYTVTWRLTSGWHPPPGETQTLTRGATITFVGAHIENYFVYIAPDTFAMGSPPGEQGHTDNETQHTVILTKGFYMSKYEVTSAWWSEVMNDGTTPTQLPRRDISWDEAVAFCNALSIKEGLLPAYAINGPNGDVTWDAAANGYRLPTEAEWEFACRAGSDSAFANGPISGICDDPVLDVIGWYCGNSDLMAHEVGQLTSNAWGLFDMHGNFYEWCWDTYREDYENLPQVDPVSDAGPGVDRVVRGGYLYMPAEVCRSAARTHYSPSAPIDFFGFRPVRTGP
jgi:formylglycine-generating enzyme required for sulfatase activity